MYVFQGRRVVDWELDSEGRRSDKEWVDGLYISTVDPASHMYQTEGDRYLVDVENTQIWIEEAEGHKPGDEYEPKAKIFLNGEELGKGNVIDVLVNDKSVLDEEGIARIKAIQGVKVRYGDGREEELPMDAEGKVKIMMIEKTSQLVNDGEGNPADPFVTKSYVDSESGKSSPAIIEREDGAISILANTSEGPVIAFKSSEGVVANLLINDGKWTLTVDDFGLVADKDKVYYTKGVFGYGDSEAEIVVQKELWDEEEARKLRDAELDTLIRQEVARAKAAEGTLPLRLADKYILSSETRWQEFDNLSAAIDFENDKRRIEVDEERQARKRQDSEVLEKLAQERRERIAGDSELNIKIKLETQRAKDSEAAIRLALNNEISRAKSVEGNLDDITVDIRALNPTSLVDAISKGYDKEKLARELAVEAEKQRAVNEELRIESRFDSEISRAKTEEARIEAESKARDGSVDFSDQLFHDPTSPLTNLTAAIKKAYNFERIERIAHINSEAQIREDKDGTVDFVGYPFDVSGDIKDLTNAIKNAYSKEAGDREDKDGTVDFRTAEFEDTITPLTDLTRAVNRAYEFERDNRKADVNDEETRATDAERALGGRITTVDGKVDAEILRATTAEGDLSGLPGGATNLTEAFTKVKPLQTPVSDPVASLKSLQFISNIEQDKNGVITAKKKNVNLDNYKTKQAAYSSDTVSSTSTGKVFIDKITQNENGEIIVTKGTQNLDYTELTSKPSINGHSLEGSLSLADLGIQGNNIGAQSVEGFMHIDVTGDLGYQPLSYFDSKYKKLQLAKDSNNTYPGTDTTNEVISRITQDAQGILAFEKKNIKLNYKNDLSNLPTLNGTEIKGTIDLDDIDVYNKSTVDSLIAAASNVQVVPLEPLYPSKSTMYYVGPKTDSQGTYYQIIYYDVNLVRYDMGTTRLTLKEYQKKEDTGLGTSSKTVVGAINELNGGKQDKLTAGTNITITGNVISAANTYYTAGANVQISADNVISATDTIYNDKPIQTRVDYLDGLLHDHEVNSDVPAGAKFTDTVYDDSAVKNRLDAIESQEAGWTGKQDKITTANKLNWNLIDSLSTVANTGKYDDLLNKPAINDAKLSLRLNGVEYQTFTANQATNAVADLVIDKSDVGLDQVDNTSDADKPISTAAQTAINALQAGKQDNMSAGTGIKFVGTQINHSNSVIAATVGTYSATSGPTLDVPAVTYDAQGHITRTGTHRHTITGLGIAAGGTGLTTNPKLLVDLSSDDIVDTLQASPRPGVVNVLPVKHGGTGVATIAAGQVLIGNGVNPITTKSITDNSTMSQLLAGDANVVTGRTVKNHVWWQLNRSTAVNDNDTGYTTYMARGEALFDSTSNVPTKNGTIAWYYA